MSVRSLTMLMVVPTASAATSTFGFLIFERDALVKAKFCKQLHILIFAWVWSGKQFVAGKY